MWSKWQWVENMIDGFIGTTWFHFEDTTYMQVRLVFLIAEMEVF
jgi:hypothetical protein